MTEIYWKAFICGIVTSGVIKLFGCRLNVALIFAMSFIGWIIGLIILINISDAVWEWFKNRRKAEK